MARDAQRVERDIEPVVVRRRAQTGERCVRGVGHVERAVGQRPRDPAVDGPDAQVARPIRVGGIEEVLDLRGRMVGSDAHAHPAQLEATNDGAKVLPADAGCDGRAGGAIRPDLLELARGALEGDPRHLGSIELHEPRGGRVGEQRLLTFGDDLRGAVDHHRAQRREAKQHVALEEIIRRDLLQRQRAAHRGMQRGEAVGRVHHVPVAARNLVDERKHRVAGEARRRHLRDVLEAEEAVALGVVGLAPEERAHERGNACRIHLSVAVELDEDIHALLHRGGVAAHCRAAHAEVALVADHPHAGISAAGAHVLASGHASSTT